MQRIFILFILLVLSGCASQRAPRLWDASLLANYPHAAVDILDKPGGKVIATVGTADIKLMLAAKRHVEEVAGLLRTDFLIADDNRPNAFSFAYHGRPTIAVNIGMINLLDGDVDAMAALIGHELAHIYLQHSKRRQSREEDRSLVSAALSVALGIAGVPVPVDAAGAATSTVAKIFSRDEEREADQFGVEFMAHAGYDPWGAVRLQEKLAASSNGKSALPFLSTHPSNAERIENMKRLSAEIAPER